jgi:polar amino acid transport system substrate-binding protein
MMDILRKLALSVAVSCNMASSLYADTIRISTGEWAPFASENLPGGGPVNSLINDVFEEAGYDPEFVYLPWRRALAEAERGRYGATSFWYYSEDRDADFIHVGPVSRETLAFARLRTTPEPIWTTLADLTEYRIGAVSGLTYTEEFWDLANTETLTVNIGPSDEANLRKLLAGRIDLYPVSVAVARHILEINFTEEERALIEISEHAISEVNGFILFARSAPNIENVVRDFEAALERHNERGAIDGSDIDLD